MKQRLLQVGLIFLLCGLLICSCDPSGMTADDKKNMSKELTYFQDDRSGLCFAAIKFTTYAGYEGYSFTNIPCERMPK